MLSQFNSIVQYFKIQFDLLIKLEEPIRHNILNRRVLKTKKLRTFFVVVGVKSSMNKQLK